MGSTVRSLVCSLQRDVKSFIAYRRISHMNYSLVVMCFVSFCGDRRRSILLLRHSFIRRILFFLAGRCLHVLGSRLVYLFRGAFLFKRMILIFLMGRVVSNFSVPPSIGFFGEASSLIVGLRSFWALRGVVLLYLFLVAYYSILLGLAFSGGSKELSFERRARVLCCFILVSLLNLIFLGLY